MQNWLNGFIAAVNDTFPDRVQFIGLQGSVARGEATERSDIDVVVILDRVDVSDIRQYGEMLDGLPWRERSCGFFAGWGELLAWEPSDLFQFYHDTKPLQGDLSPLLPLLDSEAVDRAIKIGVCSVYHGCVHNMLHEHNEEILKELYKSASFTVQAIVYQKTGRYISRQSELLAYLLKHPCDEKMIVEIALVLKQGGKVNFERMSEALFTWAKRAMTSWVEKEKK